MDVSTQTPGEDKYIKKDKLQDHAATAALYVTNANKKKSKYPLDNDNKLSSAGAASSLKYANPRDLPSFPSAGIANADSSAGAAASLAAAHPKSVEYWKPDPSASANKAAHLANDYKMAPLWHPEQSAAGSKAALLAAKEGGNVNIWRPHATEEGNSAAGQAMHMKTSPNLDYGYTKDGSERALLAATGAMSGSRRRAGSTPSAPNRYPDSANAATNALSAATMASRPSTKSKKIGPTEPSSTLDGKRIHDAAVTNLSREMYTSHPPVAPEVEEKKRHDTINAAAVVMAKQMYAVQQKALENATGVAKGDSHHAARNVHGRQSMTSVEEETKSPHQYANLQEAARKLAAERLAKLYDENAAYKNYYGTGVKPAQKLSIRGRNRRRASSDGEKIDSDESKSHQIRSEMSIFNDRVAQVDEKKRKKDREALMAAAQRNVTANMSGMDEKVFAETGKVSPAMMREWEEKARIRAEADSKARMVTHGKVSIGGGKYMDQSEIDAIAAGKVQPTLDEITVKAEAQRARDEELRQQEAERKHIAEDIALDEKNRTEKTKAEWKQFKDEEKNEKRTRKDEEKAQRAKEKRLRDEEKARKAEEKHGQEDEKHRSKLEPASVLAVLTGDKLKKLKEPKGLKETDIASAKEPVVDDEPPLLAPVTRPDPIATEEIVPITTATTSEPEPFEERSHTITSTLAEPTTIEESAPTFTTLSSEPGTTEEEPVPVVAASTTETAPTATTLSSEPVITEEESAAVASTTETAPTSTAFSSEPISTEEELVAPATAATPASPLSSDAEAIAARVFSAPVENLSEKIPIAAKAEKLESPPVSTAEILAEVSKSKGPISNEPISSDAAITKAFPEPESVRTESSKNHAQSQFGTEHIPLSGDHKVDPMSNFTDPAVAPDRGFTSPSSGSGLETTIQTKVEAQSKPPSKDSGKVSSWLRNRFSRSSKEKVEKQPSTEAIKKTISKPQPIGSTLVSGTSNTAPAANLPPEVSGLSEKREDSDRDVALASTTMDPLNTTLTQSSDLYGASPRTEAATDTSVPGLHPLGAHPIPAPASDSNYGDADSVVSALSEDAAPAGKSVSEKGAEADAGRGRTNLRPDETKDLKLSEASGGAPGAKDEVEEARDTFEPGRLPLPSFTSAGGPGRVSGASDSPVRDSKFVEEL